MQTFDESGRARFSTLAKTIARPSAGASQRVLTGLEQYRLLLRAEFIPHLGAGGQDTITTPRAIRTPGVEHMHTTLVSQHGGPRASRDFHMVREPFRSR